tara:strand:+ start:2060 stop:2806 length:747 start_codon:yes stop_codon:yes gene_type:complete
MKNMITITFCSLVTLATFAQLPEYVISNEWETTNQEKTEKLMNDWKNLILEMDENAPRTFLLTEMDGNTVYFSQAFESLADFEAWEKNFNENLRPQVLAKFREMNGENAFEGTNTEFVMSHVFKMRPDLSYVPEGMNLMEELPKHTYRRHVTVDIGWGERSAFEEMQKKQIQNDIKLNNKYITLMLEPVFGGTESGDYVMVILGESRAAYFNGLDQRMKKRNADSEWKAMRDAPIGTWIEEESLMITY